MKVTLHFRRKWRKGELRLKIELDLRYWLIVFVWLLGG